MLNANRQTAREIAQIFFIRSTQHRYRNLTPKTTIFWTSVLQPQRAVSGELAQDDNEISKEVGLNLFLFYFIFYFFNSNRNSRLSPRNGEATESVAVKEEPTDRGYVEPTAVTNLSSSTIQEPQTCNYPLPV